MDVTVEVVTRGSFICWDQL